MHFSCRDFGYICKCSHFPLVKDICHVSFNFILKYCHLLDVVWERNLNLHCIPFWTPKSRLLKFEFLNIYFLHSFKPISNQIFWIELKNSKSTYFYRYVFASNDYISNHLIRRYSRNQKKCWLMRCVLLLFFLWACSLLLFFV